MNKILISMLMSFLILGSLIGFSTAEIQGNPPVIQILSVEYTNQFGEIIDMPYYSWENILVTATISDSEGWYDVLNPDLIFGDNSLNCNRVEILSDTDAKYECLLTILPAMVGEVELHLNAIDKTGLSDNKVIENYYFNPQTTLSHDLIVFYPSGFVSGQTVTTDWINVNIDAPLNVDNPVEVVLYGKNLYEDLSNCVDNDVCTKYERVCHKETTGYKDRIKKECTKVPYEKEYTKLVCSYVNGKKVCTKEIYTKTMYKTICEMVHYQQPIIKSVCENTDNCLSWKTVKKCDNSKLHICGDSNVMELSNFEYLVEGTSNWKQVQVKPHKEIIFQGNGDSNFRIKFKVDIPSPCYGDYTLDGKNLFIELH